MVAEVAARPALTFVSVCTPDRLPALDAVVESVHEFHPGARFMVWCLGPAWRVGPRGLDVRAVDELHIHDWNRFAFQYTALELCCALKPHALLHALGEAAGTACVYLDTDVLVYSALDELIDLLQDAAIVLVPHLTAPPANPSRAVDVVKHGVYNGGILAVRPSESAIAFLRWWRERTRRDCIADADGHLFVDQYWLTLVPSLFDGVAILRHPGYNVGYWNIAERPIARRASNQWHAGGEPLRVFHFSGFDAGSPLRLSRHSDDTTAANSDLGVLLSAYAARLGASPPADSPAYIYGRLADGTPIDPRWRELIRVNHPSFSGVANPFDVDARPGLVHDFRARATDVGRLGWDPTSDHPGPGRVRAS